jgi:glutamyl-Q tRNA(Asp) synthetase
MESAPRNAIGERVYPGTCAHRALVRGALAQRVRVGNAAVSFNDLLQGMQTQDLPRDVGDFIVRRADGLFAYQLAVVVDDADQGITSVVRGADLLASTPRQIYLQQCLHVTTPEYLHVPVAIDASGEKLSKQTSAPSLAADPLPTLLAAWHFLDQPMPPTPPASAEAFVAYAVGAWSRARLPPVRMLLAPRV